MSSLNKTMLNFLHFLKRYSAIPTFFVLIITMATTDATNKGTPTQQTTITGIFQSDESLSEAAPDPDEFEFVAVKRRKIIYEMVYKHFMVDLKWLKKKKLS